MKLTKIEGRVVAGYLRTAAARIVTPSSPWKGAGRGRDTCCCWAIHNTEGMTGTLNDRTLTQRFFAALFNPNRQRGAMWFGSTHNRRHQNIRRTALLLAAAIAEKGGF